MATKDLTKQNIFVLVPGLPGWGLTDHFYWDTLTFDSQWIREMNAKVFVVEPGPISSHHDRACEIFAQICGIETDFGEEHSKKFDHYRYGRNFSSSPSLRSLWSEQNPLNFICHCSGTNTVRYLQFLLANDFWNIGTSENWVRSITSISGNINGTQFMHFFGIDSVTGTASKEKLLRFAKKVYNGAKWSIHRLKNLTETQRKKVLDWNLDHWNVSTTGEKYLQEMEKKSSIFSNNDHIFYDLTIHGSAVMNSLIPGSYPRTYYVGFYAQATNSNSTLQISHQINPLLLTPANYILNNRFYSGNLSSDLYFTNAWYDNDGMCSVACQAYPSNSSSTYQLKSLFPCSNIEPGRWYYDDLQQTIGCKCVIDHFSMIWCRTFLKSPHFQLKDYQQKEFYFNLVNFLISQN